MKEKLPSIPKFVVVTMFVEELSRQRKKRWKEKNVANPERIY